jgi:hypothetical protein
MPVGPSLPPVIHVFRFKKISISIVFCKVFSLTKTAPKGGLFLSNFIQLAILGDRLK